MRTRIAAIVTLMILTITFVGGPVGAQDSSPGATAPPDAGTPVAVPYTDNTGITHGTVTIRSIEDPFTAFDPNSPPAAGQRYVVLTVAFEAADDQSMWADPNAIVFQDADGFLRGPAWVPRAQPVTVPDLQSQTLAPGDRVSGAIGYVVPAGSALATVQYVPEYNRYIPLQRAADTPGPAVGDEVTYVDATGVTHGTVTARQLSDPYTGFDPTAPPAEGMRYVLLSVVFDAAEDQALWADPAGIVLQDANGYLIGPSGVRRPATDVVPDLQSQTLAPDDRVSGYVGYTVPAQTVITSVLWSPEGGRFMPLVDLGG